MLQSPGPHPLFPSCGALGLLCLLWELGNLVPRGALSGWDPASSRPSETGLHVCVRGSLPSSGQAEGSDKWPWWEERLFLEFAEFAES